MCSSFRYTGCGGSRGPYNKGALRQGPNVSNIRSSPPLQGVDQGPNGLKLISDVIREKLGIQVSVLMGANIASEVAEEKFCETTIGKASDGNDQSAIDDQSVINA